MQFTIVLAVLGQAAQVPRTYSTMDELTQFALGQRGFGGFTVRVVFEGHEIAVEGEMGFGLTEEVKRHLDWHPEARIIRLDSPGGWLMEAQMFRRVIEKKQLMTYTSEGCFSACASAFMGGSHRSLNPQARLGFHQPGGLMSLSWVDRGLGWVDQGIEDEKAYFVSRGVTQEFVRKAFSTPNEKTWIPTPGDLLLARVVTHIATDTDDIQD